MQEFGIGDLSYVQNLGLGHTSFCEKRLEFKRFGHFGTFLRRDGHGITQRYTDGQGNSVI